MSFFNQDTAQSDQADPEEMLRWIAQVHLSPTTLARAAFCEEVLLHEVMLGLKQYMILGAGLDTFGFRHPELNNTLQIFEVDHPATQGFKKKKLSKANLEIPDCLHFVPMDFTDSFSYSRLADEGFAYHQKCSAACSALAFL